METQLRIIRQRLDSHGALVVAGYCRDTVQKLQIRQIPIDIVHVIIALCTAIESWNSELKGNNIVVKGTDHDTIEYVAEKDVNGAQSAYGMQPISGGGIHRWKLEIVKLNMGQIGDIYDCLVVGLVTGEMNKAKKDVNTYFGGFGSQQCAFAVRKRVNNGVCLRVRVGNWRKKMKGSCGQGDVIGMTLDLNTGTVALTINGEETGDAYKGLPIEETYHLAASLTGAGTALKILSYEMLPYVTIQMKPSAGHGKISREQRYLRSMD